MALRIIWTETATSDLRVIALFIAQDNQQAAVNLAQKIFDHIEKTAKSPQSNRMVPEKEDDSIREIILRPYRIIYQIDAEQKSITVLRIWHGFRGIPEF